ncbi:flavodoxin family protein [Flavobacterium collinsii]|jgi:multimeric flavodoxin WrbA|uniref:NAD(P)H-dependent FMN-containing oxidoreductase YwqN n=1 Tax=Flavobacterium collinsii TaxID=1114861 RepID=A0A9W4X2F0_9FLAO|nr:NAD(P)H-dependent oxidoreductase [Flavobacterium collinsii]GIQ59030.1 NAD(P)H-dependent oxidoreductase [Flavobacterium collinsii]CAA9197026.1 Putative NAD(P)H-dependent FMN-containing oxidoreductase YwqN [Flavobacterium collinsii]CAI2766182.1 NAD(P)H-dependent FMN-containing oxidoreductase YwqN [Flavobacterium collinsii]
MEGKKVIILGSSRKNGNTTRIADEISKETGIEVIDLSDYNISYYDYESKNREDDFFPLIKGIIEKYDTLIFATPIYWYNMSGIMKVFFDRFSDLIRIEKETGRKLRGKKIGVISNSHDNEIEDSFYIPFKKSADYLGMEYLGHAHFNANILNQTTKIELTFI